MEDVMSDKGGLGELSRLRREQIGFVFQSFNLLDFLTVRKNVEVALNLAGVRGRINSYFFLTLF
jgi:ABC-type lipoprotein export system ATPase subunit